MDYFIGKRFFLDEDPSVIYTIYKEDYLDRNIVYVNWKGDLRGTSYTKNQVEEFFKEGVWKEPKDSFTIYEDED